MGKRRWLQLFEALRAQTSAEAVPLISSFAVLAALLIATTPAVLTFISEEAGKSSLDLPTLGFGICALLAILVRWRLKLAQHPVADWRSSISITHTAVALGCLPAVIILAVNPNFLADRHDFLVQSAAPLGAAPEQGIEAIFYAALLVLAISAWVSVTEEVIFRGLLVSVVRRWRLLPKQQHRDIAAALLSAIIFGASHYATWGPMAALALTGLGLGFVIAYIANGERLMPVIVYHFIFDALSISLSLFL